MQVADMEATGEGTPVPLDTASTALVLIGFQNEYFAESGALHADVGDAGAPAKVLAATIQLIDDLVDSEVLIVAAPIVFTPTYEELRDPVGILAAIKERGAFQAGSEGAELAPGLSRFGSRIVQVAGRRGLNAFAGTTLDEALGERGIVDVVIAGALTCVCVDSTARSAQERGYRVSVLKDCTMGRTTSEHELFCERIFPLYAEVLTSAQLRDKLGIRPRVPA